MKKTIFLLLITIFTLTVSAQQIDYYLDDDYVAEGYDVTEYFNKKTIEGKEEHVISYDGVKFLFASKTNLNKFKANPKKYIPQYGGHCAYALAKNGKKADADPETYEIRNGKLYMFYNSWGINNLENWLEEEPNKLVIKADSYWEKLKYKK